MAAKQRSSVDRVPSSDSRMSYSEFMQRFPSNDACLAYLKDKHYPDGTTCPKCGKATRFHRIKGRSAYSCQYCGNHVYPTAGTIFHKSTTSLQLWFWAIYLISSSKCGISAKQLGREIGVSYKTAHRMFKQIRTLLGDDEDEALTGDVQVDETFMRGRLRASDTRGLSGQEVKRLSDQKSVGRVVMAAVSPTGVRAAVVPDRSKPTLHGKIREFVLPESMIFTDEWKLYRGIGREYKGHRRVNHSQRIYVDSDGTTTNAVESFFALFKNSVRGAHHSISTAYLPNYLNEYTFRWNRRNAGQHLFWAILERV